MRLIRKSCVSALLAIGFLALSGTAWASDTKLDFEQARVLLERGEILSLSEIMRKTSDKFPGKILEIELEDDHGRIIYEIEFLGDDGVVMEMVIHAKTGEILSVKKD